MKHTHYNSNNQDYVYTNNTAVGQNVFITGTGGGGNINTSYYESGHARYFHQGSVGVSLQIFLDSTLLETISGGSGNITSLQDQYIHARNENHRSKYKCGFLWTKTCWRDNWVQIWEWGHRRRNATHRQEGETKSFVVNVPPSSSIRVKFVGSSDNIHKGVVSISLLESYNQSVPLADIDFDRLPQDVFTPPTSEVSGAEQQTEPLPEVQEPEVEPSPETPEVDSSENAENTEQETLPTLSREQILAYQSFLGDFMQFFTQNQNQKITENMTFLDYYNANKSEANEPYESFLNSQLMANGGSIVMRDFLADFMQSTESELVEFFANMPQTRHSEGDLLDLSYAELVGLLETEQGENSQTQGGGDVVAMPTPIIPETESYPYIPNNTRIDDREFLEKDSKEIINNAIEFAEKWEKFMRENPDFLYEREMTFNDFYLANKNKHLAESYEEFLPNRLKGSRSIKEVMQPFYYSQESWVSNQLHDFDGSPPPTTFHKYGDLADMTYTQLEEVANLLGSGRQIEYREWAEKCDTISRYGITASEYGAELYASEVTKYKGFIDSFVSFFNANPTQRLFSNRTFRDYYTRMNTEGVLSYEDWISNEINNNLIMNLMTNFYKRDDLTLKKFFALMPRPKINDNNPLLYQSKRFLYSSLAFSSTDSAESSNAESSLNIESSTTDTNESWGGGWNIISVSRLKKPNDFLGSLAVSPVFS